jgi:hydroxyacylglutathione hydrolase
LKQRAPDLWQLRGVAVQEVCEARRVPLACHAPGEVIFFRESDRVAIAGDVINTINLWTVLPRIQEPPEIFTTDPGENRRSIRKLLDLRPSLVCVGHGPPLRDISKLERLVEKLP